MRKFDIEVAKWSDERLDVFLKYRHGLLTQAQGNIVTPSPDRRIIERAPFSQASYQYRSLVGSLSRDPWSTMMMQDPLELVAPDPFTPSAFRTYKDGTRAFKIWDSAIAIPASKSRRARIMPMKKTPMLRNINDHWRNTILPAMQRVGPLGVNKAVLRAKAPWIFDLMQMDNGWLFLEGAHILAHKCGDTKTNTRKFGFEDSKTAAHLRTKLAQMIFAWVFDLPIDTDPRDEGRPGEPDFKGCHTEFKTSTWFDIPFMRCPWNNREALRFDDTLAVIDAGVFIEPHPYGFTTGTLDHMPHDRWSCSPTMVVIAGWETVDVITHQPLVAINPDSKFVPVCYGMHPMDLMPPDLFWAYLALCKRSGQYKDADQLNEECGQPNRYRYVMDWLSSPEFMDDLRRTPSFPCEDCARANSKADGAPRRPRGRIPKKKPTSMYGPDALRWQEWLTYETEMTAIRGIIQNAVEPFEARLWGGRLISNRLRKERKRGNRVRMKDLDQEARFNKLVKKKRSGKCLTTRERKSYIQHLKRKGIRNADISS